MLSTSFVSVWTNLLYGVSASTRRSCPLVPSPHRPVVYSVFILFCEKALTGLFRLMCSHPSVQVRMLLGMEGVRESNDVAEFFPWVLWPRPPRKVDEFLHVTVLIVQHWKQHVQALRSLKRRILPGWSVRHLPLERPVIHRYMHWYCHHRCPCRPQDLRSTKIETQMDYISERDWAWKDVT